MKPTRLLTVTWLFLLVLALGACVAPAPAGTGAAPADAPDAAQGAKLSIIHYFSDTLGKGELAKVLTAFSAANPGITAVDNSAGHEDFKTQILVTLAGDNPPDLFSYWAGARTQFVVDAGRLAPIDEFWAANDLDSVIPASVAVGSVYSGQKYLIPFGYHYAGFFYNPAVMEAAGITEFPADWDGFKAMLQQISDSGVAPIALGSMNRWPAQFWFDYLLLRTAGPEYRARLMAGEASYTDAEVQRVMEMWKELVDAGYFVKNANAYDWTDAANQVANGEAAMTLMGTWITGYWNTNGLEPGVNYDVFPFPMIDDAQPNAVVGPIDGWVMTAASKNKAATEELMAFLLTPQVLADWALAQGALAPSVQVDPSIYNSVMAKASDLVAAADTFAFNYDLATTPPMAEGGLNMFAQFMNDPSGFPGYLEATQAVAAEVFGK